MIEETSLLKRLDGVQLEKSRYYILDGEASASDKVSGTARSQQAHTVIDKTLGKVQKTGLVVDGEDGSLLGGRRRHCDWWEGRK